ncbi:MAG TPA: GWxTD domain-containing protein, partial [Thermoanaerobaculia bacterium]|nr:GWxTD domain-containing protein [Thermoanaerobaculia bacterium]
MGVSVGFRLLPVLFGLWLAASSLSDLFQKTKQEFKLGSYADALKTLDQLDAESAKTGLDKERAALLPALLFYRGACLAALGRGPEAEDLFEQFLAVKPDVSLDPALYPKPVIAALDRARKTVAARHERPEETGALATAYRVFVPAGGHADATARGDWNDGPVQWLLSADERRTFSGLADPASRSEFIATFWKVRDPKPETPENEFRDEFDRRADFADARFAQDEVRGSLTDRGMVFILLGPPNYGGRKRLETGDDIADASGLSRYSPSEVRAATQMGGSNTDRAARIDKVTGAGTSIQDTASNWVEYWHYLKANLPRDVPNQEIVVSFVTKQGYGKNVLQR